MPIGVYERTSLAAEQLDAAIELFLAQRSDVSALTLAGAAEEIFGQAVKHVGGENALAEAYESMLLTHRMLYRRDLSWQEYRDGENVARNAAKHMKSTEERTVETDLRRAAQWMIVRACANYDRFGLERTDRMYEFNNWFLEHEVGI